MTLHNPITTEHQQYPSPFTRYYSFNEKCLPQADVFEHLVPSWWYSLGVWRLWSLVERLPFPSMVLFTTSFCRWNMIRLCPDCQTGLTSCCHDSPRTSELQAKLNKSLSLLSSFLTGDHRYGRVITTQRVLCLPRGLEVLRHRANIRMKPYKAMLLDHSAITQ